MLVLGAVGCRRGCRVTAHSCVSHSFVVVAVVEHAEDALEVRLGFGIFVFAISAKVTEGGHERRADDGRDRRRRACRSRRGRRDGLARPTFGVKRAHLRRRRDGRAEPPLDVVQRSADRCDQILANLREQLGRCVRLVLLVPRRRCVVPRARAHRHSPREKLGGHRGLRRAARVSRPLVLVRVPHRVVVSAWCVVDSRRLDRGGRDVAALAERGLRDHAGASARGELRLEPSALRPQLVHLRLSLWRSDPSGMEASKAK